MSPISIIIIIIIIIIIMYKYRNFDPALTFCTKAFVHPPYNKLLMVSFSNSEITRLTSSNVETTISPPEDQSFIFSDDSMTWF